MNINTGQFKFRNSSEAVLLTLCVVYF